MTKYQQILSIITQHPEIPNTVVVDVISRVKDWLSSECTTEDDDYINRQLEYVNKFILSTEPPTIAEIKRTCGKAFGCSEDTAKYLEHMCDDMRKVYSVCKSSGIESSLSRIINCDEDVLFVLHSYFRSLK